MEIPPKLQRLPGPLLRFITECPPYWEYLFFSEVLEEELKKLGDLKRDWQFNVAQGRHVRLKPSQFQKRAIEKNLQAEQLMENMKTLVERTLPDAFGPPGKSGDPEAIYYVAKRLAGVYRDLLEWKLEYQRMDVPDELKRLKALAASLCDNTVSEMEAFSRALKASLINAVESARKGQSVRIHLKLALTGPDFAEAEREFARIEGLIQSGKFRWD